ncbi:MAG: ATP-binding protein [Candidatus Omnitrophica bacterium]|nr:ATP-binding protein [Candidatus Omnitrophota bacterium]
MLISESLPSDLGRVEAFISAAMAKLSPELPDPSFGFQIKLALHEALVNAVRHGNQMNPQLAVRVDIALEPGKLAITVTDQGRGFDARQVPVPTCVEHLEKLSGRGIFLIRKIMDQAEFLDQGRTIKMVKYFRGQS